MEFPANPIEFLDQMAFEHKQRLKRRPKVGESIRYMGEVSDQIGRGEDFLRIYVHNPQPRFPDPKSPETDLALLELYEYWRAQSKLTPVEPWDGTSLRPWLPANCNPTIPTVLSGDLSEFETAGVHIPPNLVSLRRLDALGNAIEQYFDAVRRHSVWARPRSSPKGEDREIMSGDKMNDMQGHSMSMHSGGGLRLYLYTELDNIETAVYSIRFWGFLKWADKLRRRLLRLPIQECGCQDMSDITFLSGFILNHFPWHDDVFGLGCCPSWEDQLGRYQMHKYPQGTQGYGLEFMQFHRDLINAFEAWRIAVGMPLLSAWQTGVTHTAYILKYSEGGRWSRGGTNGKPLNPEVVVPELSDDDDVLLRDFSTIAELGHYLDVCGVTYHGVGHIQNCDIRDQYLNLFSVRFFGWHKWIDTLFARLEALGVPLYDVTKPLDAPIDCGKWPSIPEPVQFLTGTWTYREMNCELDHNVTPSMANGIMRLTMNEEGVLFGELVMKDDVCYELSGRTDESNVNYEMTPEWWDDRLIVLLKGVGVSGPITGHVLEFRATYQPHWPYAEHQSSVLMGMKIKKHWPIDPSAEGLVSMFSAVKSSSKIEPTSRTENISSQRQVFSESGVFSVPVGVSRVVVRAWGGGGGGGSDGPGVGADNGKFGGNSRFGNFCTAIGGDGGQHGLYQNGKGGLGGTALGGKSAAGEQGETGDTQPSFTGHGGSGGGDQGGVGGPRVGLRSNGKPGAEPGGGGSGAQEGMTPAGGGGGGGFVEGTYDLVPGSKIAIEVAQGGRGGDGGYRVGGDGAQGRVEVEWEQPDAHSR